MSEIVNSAKGKKLSSQASIGQQGINFVESIVLEMGSAWHPTNASLESGIDGEIELVDPATRLATNTIIRVQSKATTRAFPVETPSSFEWPVGERDLAYWLSGNAPVVLVVSRPSTGEAYWVSVKDYFSTPARRKSLRVLFNKLEMRFSAESFASLCAVAIARNSGVYIAPRPRSETIYSNLLAVTGFSDRLWIGETALRQPADVFAKLRAAECAASEFVLRDRRILAPYDLTEPPWSAFVDRGTVDEIDARHWAASDDQELRDRFTELLNYCLKARCRQIGCRERLDGPDRMYYFAPTSDLTPRVVPYRSVRDATRRTVFLPYRYKRGSQIGDVAYYRHAAFIGQFRRFEADWYLTIKPTYFFTSDGRRRHPFYESKLKGIKALEKNATVLGYVVMWAALLRGQRDREPGLFPETPYAHLKFGELATFTLPVGIDDSSWLPNEDATTARSVLETGGDLPLFQGDEADVDRRLDED